MFTSCHFKHKEPLIYLEITSEIFQVGGAGYTAPEDAAIYLICFNGKSALVDAGCGNYLDRLYANISECGVDPKAISYLLLTHCHYDHTGGVADIHTQLGCKIFARRLDADILCEGHFGIYSGKDKIQRFIKSFL